MQSCFWFTWRCFEPADVGPMNTGNWARLILRPDNYARLRISPEIESIERGQALNGSIERGQALNGH